MHFRKYKKLKIVKACAVLNLLQKKYKEIQNVIAKTYIILDNYNMNLKKTSQPPRVFVCMHVLTWN